MIPTVLLIACVGGVLIPSRPTLVVVAITVAWATVIVFHGSTDSVAGFLGSISLGAINAIAAYALGWGLRRALQRTARL
jgi:hypothetical protein